MDQIKPNLSLLFICTGNACRSQIAEGWARHLLPQSALADRYQFHVQSAGLQTHGLNAKAVAVMREAGVDISGHTSDRLNAEALIDADWVITLCDHADQYCPLLPDRVQSRHWGLADPALADGEQGDELQPFRLTRDAVRAALVQFIAELEHTAQVVPGTQHKRASSDELVPQFTIDDVQLTRETSYRGFFELQKLHIRHRLYEGGWSDTFNRELFVRAPAVMVLLYDPQMDSVVLIEQFRVGALADTRSPWLLEMVAGMVEPGESLEEVARRESLEEAGCEILALQQVRQFWVSPGAMDEQITLFCGRVNAQQVGGICGIAEEHENIRVKVVPTDRAIQAMEDGIITNASCVIALQWLQLNKAGLQQHWR